VRRPSGSISQTVAGQESNRLLHHPRQIQLNTFSEWIFKLIGSLWLEGRLFRFNLIERRVDLVGFVSKGSPLRVALGFSWKWKETMKSWIPLKKIQWLTFHLVFQRRADQMQNQGSSSVSRQERATHQALNDWTFPGILEITKIQ
jgi:hypothetical protein